MTVDLDPKLVAQAQEILGTTTAQDTVDEALTRVIRAHAREQFIELAASGAFEDLLDPDFVRQMWR